jgi:phosphoribosylanthranilate isomerase
MAVKIKLCGLKREQDMEYANALQPDYIGFVFVPVSKRAVSKEQAKALKAKLDPAIQTVGVFTDADTGEILSIAKEGIIDIIQLHGKYDPQKIEEIKAAGYPVIQAFSIQSKEDIEKANACSVDYVLLDQGKGGSGKCFDWSLLENIKRDYFLAGGLGPENVKEAIETYHPYAIDASSSLETEGRKDFEKMKQFVHTIRSAERK